MLNLYNVFGKDFARRRLLAANSSVVMQSYLEKSFPDKRLFIYDVEIVSLDIETTGLDPTKDKIVSIGLVPIKSLGIKLDSCWHQIIRNTKSIPEKSIAIHQITDDQAEQGLSIEQAMPLLLERLSGKIMLVHNAKIEQSFINTVCQKLYASHFIIPIIDTQVIAQRRLERHNICYDNTELRLFNLRRAYNMPAYKAHNALMDAIATAELFLAMLNDNYPKNNARLKDVLT